MLEGGISVEGMEERQGAPRTDRISAAILYLTLAAAPLPMGSREPAMVALWCAILGVGLILASPRHLRRGHVALLAALLVVVACFGFVLHEQLSDTPWFASPHPVWAQTSEILGRAITPSVSMIRGEPFYALAPSLAAVLALTLGLVVGADKARADVALLVMAWAGSAYAILGFVGVVIGNPIGPMLWGDLSVPTAGYVTGPFVNRNTAAAYFGSCAAVWLVLALLSIRRHLPSGPLTWQETLRRIADQTAGHRDGLVRLLMFFVCLTAMFLTGSRAGVLVSLFAVVLVFVAFFWRDMPRARSLLWLSVAIAVAALLLLQILGGAVNARLDNSGLEGGGRFEAYVAQLQMIRDHPWFGTGLGTFAAAYPPYRPSDSSIIGVFDKAHSTPLELAVELGVPLALVIVLAWIVAIGVLLRGVARPRRETVVPLASLAVALIGLLHTSVDFSLQVVGYSLVVFALVGVGLGQSLHVGPQPVIRRRRRKSSTSVP